MHSCWASKLKGVGPDTVMQGCFTVGWLGAIPSIQRDVMMLAQGHP